MGKAAALDQGVKAAKNDILLFLDADLVGLKPHHIEEMIRAYENGSDMVVGVFREGRKATDLGQIIPYFSGQRVLSKALWEEVCRRRETEKIGFGVEIVLTKLAIKEGWKKNRVKLRGVTHVMKEEKRGISQGLLDRFKMYGDVIRSIFTKI
jgi:glycosyltransferase involved in cell wall biosynthesis